MESCINMEIWKFLDLFGSSDAGSAGGGGAAVLLGRVVADLQGRRLHLWGASSGGVAGRRKGNEDVETSTSSLAHISLASMTRESRMLLPSLELVSMKMALYSRAIFSPSSLPTHLEQTCLPLL